MQLYWDFFTERGVYANPLEDENGKLTGVLVTAHYDYSMDDQVPSIVVVYQHGKAKVYFCDKWSMGLELDPVPEAYLEQYEAATQPIRDLYRLLDELGDDFAQWDVYGLPPAP